MHALEAQINPPRPHKPIKQQCCKRGDTRVQSPSPALCAPHTHRVFVSGSVGKLIRRTEFLVMEDATLLWFWVLSLLLMNYKWQQGKWRTPAVTVCQPRSLCARFFGWITFSFFVHLHHSLRFPSSPLPPLPLLAFTRGDGRWKRGQPLIRARDAPGMGLGWGRAAELWMGFQQRSRWCWANNSCCSRGRALCSAITCLQTAGRKGTQHWNVSYQEMLLLSSSLSIRKPASRLEQGLLGAGSSFFVLLQIVNLLLQSSCFS